MKRIRLFINAYFVFLGVMFVVTLYMSVRLFYVWSFNDDFGNKILFYVTEVHPELEFDKTHDSTVVDLNTFMFSFWVWNPRDFAKNKLLFDEINNIHLPPKVVPVYSEEEIRKLISQDKKIESESR